MKQHHKGFLDLVNAAKQHIAETDVDTIHERIKIGEKIHLIDVREDTEWARGHCPGAIHIGKGVIERDIEQHFPDHNTPLVLYCGGGYRSALACESLMKMGYTDVISMDGGFSTWCERGYVVER